MKCILSDRLLLYNLNAQKSASVKQALTLENPAYCSALRYRRPTKGLVPNILLYKEGAEGLYVPRGYSYSLSKDIDTFIDLTALPPIDNITSNISLYPYQEPFLCKLMKHRYGVGVAPPGSGKTIIGIEAIARINTRTLWVTHTTALANQTLNKMKDCLDIDSSRIGFVGGGKRKFGDITVGMVRSLIKIPSEELKYKFGLVIIDEFHHEGGMATFYKLTNMLAPKYMYGLTATPFRQDGLDSLMFLGVGPIVSRIYRDQIKDKVPVLVKVIKTDLEYTYNKRNPRAYNYLMKKISKDRKRNQKIITLLRKEVTAGKLCIVLSGRVAHLENMKKLAETYGIPCGIVHTGVKKKLRPEIYNKFNNEEIKVLFATYLLLGEGFDVEALSVVFMSYPIKSKGAVEQVCGRVERPHKNKISATVYDIFDHNIEVLEKQFFKREAVYKDLGFAIK
jgi:superfamily II DNA or RNA helicase